METQIINQTQFEQAYQIFNSNSYTYFYQDSNIDYLSDLSIDSISSKEVSLLVSFRIDVDGEVTEFYKVTFIDGTIIYFTEIVTETEVIEVDISKEEFNQLQNTSCIINEYRNVNNTYDYTILKEGLKGALLSSYKVVNDK